MLIILALCCGKINWFFAEKSTGRGRGFWTVLGDFSGRGRGAFSGGERKTPPTNTAETGEFCIGKVKKQHFLMKSLQMGEKSTKWWEDVGGCAWEIIGDFTGENGIFSGVGWLPGRAAGPAAQPPTRAQPVCFDAVETACGRKAAVCGNLRGAPAGAFVKKIAGACGGGVKKIVITFGGASLIKDFD